MNKQQKNCERTAVRSAARRTKVAFVVMVLADRNRGRQMGQR
jgi:hypothetical protein